MFRLLSLSGSLRHQSSNSTLLNAMQQLDSAQLVIERYEGIALLPHFNPDLLAEPPAAVVELERLFSQADALLISCPEYARGIPGSFKNMLDWLVSSQSFPGMPVVLINTSPRASHAQDALRLVLSTMSADIVEQACFTVNLLASRAGPEQLLEDPHVLTLMNSSLQALEHYLIQTSGMRVGREPPAR